MIDIHAHILPGLDDGSPDLASSLAMAEIAVESGVTAIAATPHCNMPGRFANYWGSAMRRQLRNFTQALKDAGIHLAIYPGMEVFGTPDVPRLLQEGKLAPLGGSHYLLIEFPFYDYGLEATKILGALLSLGCCPVVAHPERYRYTQADPPLLNRWVDMGCLLQINRGSLLGRFGNGAQMLSFSMLDRGFAAAVATDAHSPVTRTTWLRDVWELLSQEFSEDTAELLLEANPQRILQDLPINRREPEWF